MHQHRKARILIAKPGLDGHDRGAKYVARLLSEADYQVIYSGIRRTPEWIVSQAIDADVAAIGLSILSGAHNDHFRRVMELLDQQDATHIAVVGGGIIPPHDIPSLKSIGVRAIFTPGARDQTIVDTIGALIATQSRDNLGRMPHPGARHHVASRANDNGLPVAFDVHAASRAMMNPLGT